jgi:hypothetical protein
MDGAWRKANNFEKKFQKKFEKKLTKKFQPRHVQILYGPLEGG